MHDNFELAAMFLAPTCSVAKKQGNKKVAFDTTISATNGKKYGQGKTGVELQYHKKHEFLALPKNQEDEQVAIFSTAAALSKPLELAKVAAG